MQLLEFEVDLPASHDVAVANSLSVLGLNLFTRHSRETGAGNQARQKRDQQITKRSAICLKLRVAI
jgi:hypothetical protein